jgi:hypothetical protein
LTSLFYLFPTGETKKRSAREVPFPISLAFVHLGEGVAPAFRKRDRGYQVPLKEAYKPACYLPSLFLKNRQAVNDQHFFALNFNAKKKIHGVSGAWFFYFWYE